MVSVHVPLDSTTHHLLGAAELDRMKPGSLLINTARGAVVDVSALRQALAVGRLGRVALDVVEGEPELPHWLRDHPRVLLTPHAAFYSVESLAELRTRAAEAVRGADRRGTGHLGRTRGLSTPAPTPDLTAL